MSRKTKIILVALGLIPLAAFSVWGYFYPSSFIGSQETVRDFVTGYGAWAPIIFIAIQILQVIIAPISHHAIGVAGGFIFGTWYGFAYNYIGRLFGHSAAFFLSHTFGRPLVKRFIKPETLEKYDRFWDKGGTFFLFLVYYLPLFPDDEISYIAGTSSMRFGPFLVANLLGQIGGSLSLAYIGAGFQLDALTFGTVLLVNGVLSFALTWIWWKRRKNKDSGIHPELTW